MHVHYTTHILSNVGTSEIRIIAFFAFIYKKRLIYFYDVRIVYVYISWIFLISLSNLNLILCSLELDVGCETI